MPASLKSVHHGGTRRARGRLSADLLWGQFLHHGEHSTDEFVWLRAYSSYLRKEGKTIMKDAHLTRPIVEAAVQVHRQLGPGLLESAYAGCLLYELNKNGVDCSTECPVSIRYDNMELDFGYRIDILVSNAVVVELKAVRSILPIHKAQLLTYMRLGDYPLGLLINFNVLRLTDGICRMVI